LASPRVLDDSIHCLDSKSFTSECLLRIDRFVFISSWCPLFLCFGVSFFESGAHALLGDVVVLGGDPTDDNWLDEFLDGDEIMDEPLRDSLGSILLGDLDGRPVPAVEEGIVSPILFFDEVFDSERSESNFAKSTDSGDRMGEKGSVCKEAVLD
jgi:hypothetical protein